MLEACTGHVTTAVMEFARYKIALLGVGQRGHGKSRGL
jgi:hypothetical protein